MNHVLTWPSEIGPCVAPVSRAVFAARAHADNFAERSGDALLYPPPAWARAVRVGAEPPLFPWLAVLCLVLAAGSIAASFYVMSGYEGQLQPAPAVQPVKQKLMV